MTKNHHKREAEEVKKTFPQETGKKPRDWRIFMSSIFFVLGFSFVFSILGVLLQGALSSISFQLQLWLGRIGGVLIIAFGLYMTGLIKVPWLEREHKFTPKLNFSSMHLTSFAFGAAFAVGWTPCVGPVLGAVLTLAVAKPSTAFVLLMSYSLGIGIPFMLFGFFTNEARRFVRFSGKWLKHLQRFFGAILVALGVLVFTNKLATIANFIFASEFLINLQLNNGFVNYTAGLNIGIAFLAGIVSFLSPCVLPLIPAFLAYLASVGIKKPS